MTLKRTTLNLALILAATAGTVAQDWNQWRGPGRDGIVSQFEAPESWPGELTLAWKIAVGEGHSSPLWVDDRIYLHSRMGEDEVVAAYSAADGSKIWENRVETPYTMDSAALDHGKGPKSTPVFHEGVLYTFGISGTLSAIVAETGELGWRISFGDRFEATSPLFGTAASPLIVDDVVVAHVGGHERGALAAFELADGKLRWEWTGDGPGYSSPIVIEMGGTRQIVTQSQQWIIALDAASGAETWKMPFVTSSYQNSVSPVALPNSVLWSGLDQGTFAVRSGLGAPETLWKTTRSSFYMNTPVLRGGRLYGLSHKRRGQFVCLDATSGEAIWGSLGREGENAAILATPQHVFFLTTDARLVIVDAGATEYVPAAEYSVADSPTWAHPVIQGNSILIKDLQHLARWTF